MNDSIADTGHPGTVRPQPTDTPATYRFVAIEAAPEAGPLARRAGAVLKRTLEGRSGARIVAAEQAGLTLFLAVDPSIAKEGFRIEATGQARIRIAGADERGVLYGTGRFLRSSRFTAEGFTPGEWRGESVPRNPVRGIYFATHFHNFYHDAPIKRVQEYVEELALWGTNALQVWFDMHHYDGIHDPDAQRMLDRLAAILKTARDVGMEAGIGVLGNEAYRSSPQALRADPHTRRSHYSVELCPYKPGAKEQMLAWCDEELSAFAERGVTVDTLWLWPYDQGGCACDDCRPWGANGFLVMAEAIARLARKRLPSLRVVLSTWLFDYMRDEGEWSGLAEALDPRPDWVDCILADSHSDFPPYLLEHPVPGGLPVLNFPEISMWGMWPWGAIGANPLPARFQRLWDQAKGLLSGGFPYSEGIFEDLNKAVCSQFYWDPDRRAEDIVREYAGSEFGPDVTDAVMEAVRILEANHRGCIYTPLYREGGTMEPDAELADAGAARAFALLQEADRQLPNERRTAWRWRILYLRAFLDKERLGNRGQFTPACEAALEELTTIYTAEHAESRVAPPSLRAIARLRDQRQP